MSPAQNTIRIVKWAPNKQPMVVSVFLNRRAIEAEAERVARDVLEAVKRNGNRALVQYAKRFDEVELKVSSLAVAKSEFAAARRRVDDEFKRAAQEAHGRIVHFARSGMRREWHISSPKGGQLGELFSPLDRVGAYIPGGAAPLASTALMTVTLARVAGVPEIVACTPCDKHGRIDPHVLYALELAGASEVYRIGGIQAIGAMAYGTRTIRKVQKIVGPGNAYVTAAKRLVYGDVDLDLVAGPSEIAVLADESAAADRGAADLLSQAEHGTGMEKCLLVTPCARLANRVQEELLAQMEKLPRRETIQTVLKKGTLLVVVDNLDIGMELVNRFAPEHLELLVSEPRTWLKKVRAAGAVFVGPWTPECAGDFAAGPSHVLPTGGAARIFSGLTVDHFRRRTSFVAFTQADLKDTLPIIKAFGRVERLEAHVRSATIRFQ